jgi:hypothetical protein
MRGRFSSTPKKHLGALNVEAAEHLLPLAATPNGARNYPITPALPKRGLALSHVILTETVSPAGDAIAQRWPNGRIC